MKKVTYFLLSAVFVLIFISSSLQLGTVLGNLDRVNSLALVSGGSGGDQPTGAQCPTEYFSGATWPISPVVPPLPPQDPHPYVPGEYDCRHFATNFCSALKLVHPEVDCSRFTFDHHEINFIEYTDDQGEVWVCVVEPQKNNEAYFCMKKSEWLSFKGGWEKWTKEILCRQIYHMSKEECNNPLYTPKMAKYLGTCSSAVGSSCSNTLGGDVFGYCSDPFAIDWNPPGYKNLSCNCKLVEGKLQCKWKVLGEEVIDHLLIQPTPPQNPKPTSFIKNLILRIPSLNSL